MRAWAAGRPGLRERLASRGLRIWHHRFRSPLSGEVSLGRLLGGLVKLTLIVGIASTVFWTELFKPNPAFAPPDMLGLTAALSGLMFLNWLWDREHQRRRWNDRHREHLQGAALQHDTTISAIAPHLSFDERNPDHRDRLIRHTLCCITEAVRGHLGEYGARYFEASLIVFDDDAGTQMRVFSRAGTTRPTGVAFPSRHALAFHVAMADTARAANDLHNMPGVPARGLSNTEMPYRSALFMPISLEDAKTGATFCKGVVTIDSSRPYEFWGPIARDVEIQVRPFVSLIGILLQKQTQAVPIPREQQWQP